MATVFLSEQAQVDRASTEQFPASRKIYVVGSRPDIRVPMREISLTDTPTAMGGEKNAPVVVYDTSGPYTDPEVKVDIRQGLAAVREGWVVERNDTELLAGPTSRFGLLRERDISLTPLRFGHLRKPRRALPGRNVTQLHYARQGIITPEMEYIAIRENGKREWMREYLGDPEREARLRGNPMGMAVCTALAALTFIAIALLRWPLAWVLPALGLVACAWAWRQLGRDSAKP